jgi:hypothetical protein
VAVLESTLDRYDDTHARDKALYLTWLADAYLDANEVERGCAVAARAARLTPYAELSCVAELRATQGADRSATDSESQVRHAADPATIGVAVTCSE